MDDRRLDRRLFAFVAGLCALLVANDLLPYLGLRDDSCQTMFCGLTWTATDNNHYFMPQHAVSDLWLYLTDVRAEIEPEQPASARVDYLVGWLNQEDRGLNPEAMRAVVRQICDAGHSVRLTYRDPETDELRTAEDACRVDRLSSPAWWIPVRLYETDLPAEP